MSRFIKPNFIFFERTKINRFKRIYTVKWTLFCSRSVIRKNPPTKRKLRRKTEIIMSMEYVTFKIWKYIIVKVNTIKYH